MCELEALAGVEQQWRHRGKQVVSIRRFMQGLLANIYLELHHYNNHNGRTKP